jgi:hypothetical protein
MKLVLGILVFLAINLCITVLIRRYGMYSDWEFKPLDKGL